MSVYRTPSAHYSTLLSSVYAYVDTVTYLVTNLATVSVVGFGMDSGECMGEVVEKNMLDQVCVC